MATENAMTPSEPENPEYQLVEDYIGGAYILAVDDFSVIRRIVTNTLRAKEAYVDEAANGQIALDKMRLAFDNKTPYDLVFLDIEMPVMDGIAFLKKLRPDKDLGNTEVIVLTSHSDAEEINECLSMGIVDYIIKPVNKERLYNAVAKAMKKRHKDPLFKGRDPGSTVSDQKAEPVIKEYSKLIFRKLETIEQLPSLPAVLEKVKNLTSDPNSNSEQIARIMEDDPSMMANVLKVANSALYGARERIESLQAAITRLGLNTVRNIATSMGVLSVFTRSGVQGFNHKEFSRHSICTGIAMCVIYDYCRAAFTNQFSRDFLHLTGLLHDIGKIIIVQFFHDEYVDSISLGKQHSLPLFLAEQKALGVDHAEVGAWLGTKWNLAESQIQSIRFHHDPLLTTPEHEELVMLCHAANYLCNLEKFGDAGDNRTPFFDQRALDRIGLKVNDLPAVAERVVTESKHSEVLISLLV